MILALFVILLFQLLGEVLRAVLHLPVPGPVVGMFLLVAALLIRRRLSPQAETPADLDRVARFLVANMGLLFVPAGVGVVAMIGLVEASWLPITVGLVGSTILSLLATGLVMHALSRREAP